MSAVQFLDLPADQSATVEDFLEKTMSEVNPVKLALMRWQLQAQLLKVAECFSVRRTVSSSFSLPLFPLSPSLPPSPPQETISNLRRGDFAGLLQADSDQLVRDEFNTRKMIVTVTTSGKVSSVCVSVHMLYVCLSLIHMDVCMHACMYVCTVCLFVHIMYVCTLHCRCMVWTVRTALCYGSSSSLGSAHSEMTSICYISYVPPVTPYTLHWPYSSEGQRSVLYILYLQIRCSVSICSTPHVLI